MPQSEFDRGTNFLVTHPEARSRSFSRRARVSRLDLVSCRNLLIYLNREAQSRAFDIFHFALRPGGRLFLGTSEAVDDGSPHFAVIDKKQRLYMQRPGPHRLIAVPSGPGTLARALALQERTRERPTVPGQVTVESVQAGLDPAVPLESGLPPANFTTG